MRFILANQKMFLKEILLVFILYKLNSCQDNNTTFSAENTTISTPSSEPTSSFDNFTILVSSSEMNNETTSIGLNYSAETMTSTISSNTYSNEDTAITEQSTYSLPSEMNNETTSIQLYYTTENMTQTSTPSIKGRPIIKD